MSYSLYQRAGKGPFIVTFVDPTTGRRTNRSTKTPRRREAEKLASEIVNMSRQQLATGPWGPWYTKYVASLELRDLTDSHMKNVASAFKQLPNNMTIEQMSLPQALQDIVLAAATGQRRGTINGHLRRYRAFLNWLHDSGHLEKRPTVKLLPMRDSDLRQRSTLNESERDHLMSVVSNSSVVRAGFSPEERYAAYALALFAGLRKGEVLALKREQVFLNVPQPYLYLVDTKNGTSVKHIIGTYLTGILRNFLAAQGDKLFTQGNILRALQHDLEDAGIPYHDGQGQRDFHSLRKTFVTLLIRNGADIKSVQTLARHADPMMTLKFYAQVQDSQLTSVINLLDPPSSH